MWLPAVKCLAYFVSSTYCPQNLRAFQINKSPPKCPSPPIRGVAPKAKTWLTFQTWLKPHRTLSILNVNEEGSWAGRFHQEGLKNHFSVVGFKTQSLETAREESEDKTDLWVEGNWNDSHLWLIISFLIFVCLSLDRGFLSSSWDICPDWIPGFCWVLLCPDIEWPSGHFLVCVGVCVHVRDRQLTSVILLKCT